MSILVLARLALVIYQPTVQASLDFSSAESLAHELNACNNNIRVLTIFLGEVATKLWQEYDFSYYEKNKSKMLRPQDVAAKIAEMIYDTKIYKNGVLLKCMAITSDIVYTNSILYSRNLDIPNILIPFEFDEQQNEAWNCNDVNSVIKRSSFGHSFKSCNSPDISTKSNNVR